MVRVTEWILSSTKASSRAGSAFEKQLKIATRAVCYFEVIYANEQKTISVKYVYSITSQRRIKNSYKNIKVDKVDLVNVCDSMIALPA